MILVLMLYLSEKVQDGSNLSLPWSTDHPGRGEYNTTKGPGNIIVEDVPKVGSVGIIDWEIAGYYPRGWIRTKFRICSGLDIPNPVKEQHWWRWEVQKSLGEHGFEDYSEKWGSWWY
jgi:hypothetical protein